MFILLSFNFIIFSNTALALACIFFNSNTIKRYNSLHKFGILIISVLWLKLVLNLIVLSYFIRQYCIQKILSYTSKVLSYLKDYLLKIKTSGCVKKTKAKSVSSKPKGPGPNSPKFDNNIVVGSDSSKKKRKIDEDSDQGNKKIKLTGIYDRDNPKYKNLPSEEALDFFFKDRWRKFKDTIYDPDNSKYKDNPYFIFKDRWRKSMTSLRDPDSSKYKNLPSEEALDYVFNRGRWTKFKVGIYDRNNIKYINLPSEEALDYYWNNIFWSKIGLKDGGCFMRELPNKTDADYLEAGYAAIN